MRLILIFHIILMHLCLAPGHSQIMNANDAYDNGQRMYTGRYIYCVTPDKKVPGLYHHEKRQFGKWIYYYPNGNVREMRNFTKRVKNCDDKILKHGQWKYFNIDGIHYLTELYNNDELIYSELDIYEKNSLVGKFIKNSSTKDTLIYHKKEGSDNLIRNPSFEEYYFKPIPIENDGKDQIQNLIPFWYSPDSASPDYYNIHRRVSGIPDHFFETDYNGYVGLLLFRGREVNVNERFTDNSTIVRYPAMDYTESIKSKLRSNLSKDKVYCFKMNILLSPHSGYSIDKIGVLFSSEPLYYSYFEVPKENSFLFSEALDNTSDWKTLCKSFVASGNEAFITIGRFTDLEDTEIIRRKPLLSSQLDLNISAYYLIDDLQLYEVDSHEMCGCMVEKIPESSILFDELDFENAGEVRRFILGAVHFDFDKSEIKESFLSELNKLLTILIRHPDVKIRINGHTDNEGTDDYNYKLSKERARAIFLWLINNGIDQSRISYKGHGSDKPLMDSSSDINKEINRRVEFEIIEN